MTPQRFQQIEELYQAVRESTAGERAALLAQTDPELRREVESLLAQGAGLEFLNRPALQNAPQLLEEERLTAAADAVSLGPYRIERKLGEGGMGEVFRAIDTRLGRAVAIKTTRKQFTTRFEREARTISSLNHPHICTLYDVGVNYLVMELVEGETIAALLKGGPLPVTMATLYASQIAAALVEAHGKRVIHLDLKPGNIMIAKSGVKVLDFGLAKSGQDETVTASHMLMGTPAYMAPEQRQGKPADGRTDIYSFGCVLYEMLTGARVGSRRKPCPSRKLERIVSRCLEEDPARRWQSAAELERELAGVTAPGSSRKRMLAAAGVILALSATAYFYFHRAAPGLAGKSTIVLADFDNKTGDPVFDDTLRLGLSVELQQSPFLALISERKVQRTMALLGQPKDAKLTSALAQQICERTASTAVLEGSIARVGSQYVLGLRAKNCKTGDMLDQQQVVAANREDVLQSLHQIARKFRTGAGESLAAVEKNSTPLEEATTPSIEALKAYSTANKLNLSSGFVPAMPFLRRAVEIDPEFATAYAYLGFGYGGIGETILSAVNATKAWQLRNRVSDRERFFIDWVYNRQVTGNLEKAYQTLESWLQAYPEGDEPHPLDLLGGISSHGTGRFERVIEVSRKRLATDPDFMYANANLAVAYFFTGRFAEAERSFQRAAERKVEQSFVLFLNYTIAALNGDKEQMERVMVRAKGKRGAERRVVHVQALALARSGRFEAARRSSNRAADLALEEGDREAAASYQAARAVWEAICGNAAEGNRNAAAALALSKGRDVEYPAGLALALSGSGSRAEAIADDLERRFPEDTFVKFTYAPVLHGISAMERRKPAEAVERLNRSLLYEGAVNGLNFGSFYLGGLHSAYVRGQALLAIRRYPEAIAEFQKILAHRGLVGLDPIGALVHLQLGRVYVLSSDKAKAKSAYESFLELWKDADADIPILKQAKAEYANLR